MKCAMLYQNTPGFMEKAPPFIEQHRARIAAVHGRGLLLMTGPLTDGNGAMGLFTTRESADEFARGDPFVLNGVVASWEVREWREVLA